MSVADVVLSHDPRTGRHVGARADTSPDGVEETVAAAASAAPIVAGARPTVRACWLRALADALEGDSERLVGIADEETALGVARLAGELSKAAATMRFYGEVAAEGSWLAATIDHAGEQGPDLRRMNVALGPVAVFGASNFPFGFGVLGHDTASALATGCPVVVKAHPAHPRLSYALAELACSALRRAGGPEGTVGAVAGYAAGTQLVRHPQIRAVAFTGSQAGGLALWRLASARAEVIPVYAEMGTVNSVIVTRRGAHARSDAIASGFVQSFTLGMGQFCTKPGLIAVPRGCGLTEKIADVLRSHAPEGWLLTADIANAYADGIERLIAAGAALAAASPAATTGYGAAPTLLRVEPASLFRGTPLLAECFGPVALSAEYGDDAELEHLLGALPGSLVAAVHGSGPSDPDVAAIIHRLSGRVGRVVVDGWPTGVAVSWAQQHGGPWPATTAPSATSVGAAALSRFVRPLAYQDVPDAALPAALQEANPWHLPRRVDGVVPR